MKLLIVGQTIFFYFFCFNAMAMIPDKQTDDFCSIQKSIDRYSHSIALPLKYNFFIGDFALWCNALACKQVIHEDAGTLSVKKFLRAELDKHKNQTIPRIEQHVDDPYRDQRLARRWRTLETGHGINGTCTALGNRNHINIPLCASSGEGNSSSGEDNSSSDELGGLYNNTLCMDSAMLDAAVHANSSEKIWVELKTLDVKRISNCYPLHILWVEYFQQPRMLLKKMFTGNHRETIFTNTGVIVAEDDASFRVYRPKEPPKPVNNLERDSLCEDVSFIQMQMLPSLSPRTPCNNAIIETYSLARITETLHQIPFSYLAHWYAAFIEFRMGNLTQNNLAAVTWQMRLMANR